jgi:hypothetical protein
MELTLCTLQGCLEMRNWLLIDCFQFHTIWATHISWFVLLKSPPKSLYFYIWSFCRVHFPVSQFPLSYMDNMLPCLVTATHCFDCSVTVHTCLDFTIWYVSMCIHDITSTTYVKVKWLYSKSLHSISWKRNTHLHIFVLLYLKVLNMLYLFF